MKLIIKENYEEMSLLAADIVKNEIIKNPNLVLGLPTGSTPKGMYRELIRCHKEEDFDLSSVTTFNLDEYVGIGKEHPSSYNYFMCKYFFNEVNIKKENIFIPNGKSEDLESHCKEYDELIEGKGGIDLQILGIGENGHIAFNEPDEGLNITTSVVGLTDLTIESNSRFFDSMDEMPRTAITMGMGSIMKARKILLLANGKRKTEIMRNLIESNTISTRLPASILLLHPDLTIIMDEEAYKG